MQSLGAVPLVMLLVLVVLALDSRRLHALARAKVRTRREAQGGIPAGANPDQVGLPLRQIQMRIRVDWEDGGVGSEGAEILPVETPAGQAPADRVAAGNALSSHRRSYQSTTVDPGSKSAQPA